MRFDSVGLFWQDQERQGRLQIEPGPQPIPDTGWVMPTEFPRLESAKRISIDLETHDPDLTEKGPGMRRDGYICGIAVGAQDDAGRIEQWYFPFGHVLGENMSEVNVLKWAKDALAGPQPKVGANILYDIMYLDHAGIDVGGQWYDVLMGAFLLDENKFKYDLDAVAERYLGEHKKTNILKKWLEASYLGNWKGNIWRGPTSLVAPYAEQDAALPLKLYDAQAPLMKAQGLGKVYDLESRLLPMLLAMSKQSVRVDIKATTALNVELETRILRDTKALGGINVDAPAEIAPLFDKLGLSYPITKKAKTPSFTKGFLENHEHPIAKQIMDLRKWKKFKSTFIEGYILGKHIDGRVYPTFNPRGARTGRFSSSKPNLQNIPSRDPELGPLVRSLFIPEDGDTWYKLDYSQIEYRYLTHLGTGDVAEALRKRYCTDMSTDIHQEVAELLKVSRSKGKNLNFGIVYGLGVGALAASLKSSIEDTKELKEEYARLFPFAKQLSDKASGLAGNRGWIKTLLGRRRRFDSWEPADYALSKKQDAFATEELCREFVDEAILNAEPVERIRRGVRRAYLHKALNAVIQGSAADIIKKAMVDGYEAGVFKEITPCLTCHDELDFSTTDEKLMVEAKEIMEKSTSLSVPLIVDMEKGPNWGYVK